MTVLQRSFSAPTQIRAELEKKVRLDLLGPAAGPEEEIAERNVRGRYIVGLLAPRGQTVLPDLEDDLAATDGERISGWLGDGQLLSAYPFLSAARGEKGDRVCGTWRQRMGSG